MLSATYAAEACVHWTRDKQVVTVEALRALLKAQSEDNKVHEDWNISLAVYHARSPVKTRYKTVKKLQRDSLRARYDVLCYCRS
jgi:hypothetical protein